MDEKTVERRLRDMVEQHGGLCLKWVCPGWAGVPDRMILLPGGVVLFVEVKRPKGGRFSPLQLWWADRLRALGFRYYAVRNYDDIRMVEECICSYIRTK